MAADHGLHVIGFVVLGLVQLFAGQLAIDQRIGTTDVAGHVAVGDATHFKRMQATELRDLLKRQRGVVDQPDRSGLGHQDVGHSGIPVLRWSRSVGPRIRRRPAFRPGVDGLDIVAFAGKENETLQSHTAKVHRGC